jgi:hypothetical protein
MDRFKYILVLYVYPLLILCVLVLGSFKFKETVENDKNPKAVDPMPVELKKFYNPLFIEFKNKSVAGIHVISENKLFVRTHGSLLSKEHTLTIRNSKNVVIGIFALNETRDSGDDFYIDLEKNGINFLNNRIYQLELQGAMGKALFAFVKRIDQIDQPLPEASIHYNVLSISCESEAGNVVDYYGNILSGVPPFNYMWLVYKEPADDKPLYQPVVGTLANSGNIPGITVDRHLGYTVVFAIRDMCGNYTEKRLDVECGNNFHYGNTIFLQTTPTNIKTTPDKN